MNNLYLLQFNNYYNRIVKKHSTIQEYENDGAAVIGVYSGVNFIPKDGINTTQILNYTPTEQLPDYLLVCDNANNILSRWYIIRSNQTRAGQYQLNLYRDVIADWYDEVISAPCFIEKAKLTIHDPRIFNHEQMTFNQIKQSETLLKDKSQVGWIVGYVDKAFHGTFEVEDFNSEVDYNFDSFAQYQYDNYATNPFKVDLDQRIFRYNFYDRAGIIYSRNSYCIAWDNSGSAIAPFYPSQTTGRAFAYSPYIYEKPQGTKGIGFACLISSEDYATMANGYAVPYIRSQVWSDILSSTYVSDLKNENDLSLLMAENNKIMRVGNNYYQIKVTKTTTTSTIADVSAQSYLGMRMNGITTILEQNYDISPSITPTDPRFQLEVKHANYIVSYVPYTINKLSFTIPQDRSHSNFLPYDVFCIPYGYITCRYAKTDNSYAETGIYGQYGLKMANALIRGAGDNLKDIQLLPYCPVQSRVVSGNLPRVNAKQENGDWILSYTEMPDSPYSCGIWVDNPDFSFTIGYTIPEINDPIEEKVSNECEMYRLVSPNYNGQFEFSPAKNLGVRYFDVDCSYKPFTPYIKIAPRFNFMYGSDFNDARGLICGGDFSLPQISDPWVNYQIQNKNYLNIFNREIENLDFINNYQREMEKWNLVGGALSGGGTLGLAGGVAGGAGVGIAGAIGGTAASVIGGIADIHYNEKIRQETRDYRMDLFGYQLGNIQALPSNLTKVSSFNPNNKIFPILEHYSATEVEKDALRQKIKWDGMTVMTCGIMKEFIIPEERNYMKGQLIRLLDDTVDYHTTLAIADEINKGVFI